MDASDRSSAIRRRRLRRLLPLAGFAGYLVAFPPFRIVSIDAPGKAEATSGAFDGEAFASRLWREERAGALERATELGVLRQAFEADASGARARHGRAIIFEIQLRLVGRRRLIGFGPGQHGRGPAHRERCAWHGRRRHERGIVAREERQIEARHRGARRGARFRLRSIGFRRRPDLPVSRDRRRGERQISERTDRFIAALNGQVHRGHFFRQREVVPAVPAPRGGTETDVMALGTSH